MQANLLSKDLDYILENTLPLWDELRNQRLFITGGTGFFGCWFLESFVWANTKLDLNASAVVLTRNKLRFQEKYPYLFEHTALHFHEGDVKDFKFIDGNYSYVIHAATDASTYLNETNSILTWNTIVQGTQHALKFAVYCKAKCFLLVSSGAVYGRQPPEISHLSENYPCQPQLDDFRAAYAVGKYAAEHICYLYAKKYGLNIKIARCFTVIGPYLPLDAHFAIGNFIRDGLNGGPIIVNGDGTSYRSYLYAADLAVWMWTILFRGKTARSYNVGSDEAYTIAELAYIVAKNFCSMPEVTIMKSPRISLTPERYVPDISRARDELGLVPLTSVAQAIQATVGWHTYFRQ